MVMYATLVVFQRDLDSIALLVGQVASAPPASHKYHHLTCAPAPAAAERGVQPGAQALDPPAATRRRAHGRQRHALGALAVHRLLRRLRRRLHVQATERAPAAGEAADRRRHGGARGCRVLLARAARLPLGRAGYRRRGRRSRRRLGLARRRRRGKSLLPIGFRVPRPCSPLVRLLRHPAGCSRSSRGRPSRRLSTSGTSRTSPT
jgi:hypothetical protein